MYLYSLLVQAYRESHNRLTRAFYCARYYYRETRSDKLANTKDRDFIARFVEHFFETANFYGRNSLICSLQKPAGRRGNESGLKIRELRVCR